MATRKCEKERTPKGSQPQKYRFESFKVTVIGDTPLICHSLKCEENLGVSDKEKRKPWRRFCDSLNWISRKPENPTRKDIRNADLGFPSMGFKKSMLEAGLKKDVLIEMSPTNASFCIMDQLTKIQGIARVRKDRFVICENRTVAVYRLEFKQWSAALSIRYNAEAITRERIIDLLDLGGSICGVGCFRPAQDGEYGKFHVANEGK